MTTLGERIRDARQRAVLTQAELAATAGIALITVSRLENGAIATPRPATIRQLARVLDVDPAWLLFGDAAKIAA